MNGSDITISVEDPAVPGTYILVGSQRDVTLNESTEAIDESSKDSRNGVFSPGRYSASLDLDALYVPGDAAYGHLQDAMRDGTMVRVEVIEDGTDVENIGGVVTSLNRSGPDQGEAVISATIQLSGAWVAAA